MKSTITKSFEVLPPEGDPKVGHKVMGLLEQIFKFKADRGLPGKWQRCYELTRGHHWKNASAKGAPLVTANLLFRHRQATLAMLTDNNPTFNVKQAGDMDEGQVEMLEVLEHTTEHWWNNCEQQKLFEMSVLDGETYGPVVEKGRFDPDDEYGLGEVKFEQVDPYHFGWWPVKGPYEAASAALQFRPVPLIEARRRWPNHADEIFSDAEWIRQMGDNRNEIGSVLGADKKSFFSTAYGFIKEFLNEGSGASEDEEDVLIIECWVKDYSRTREGDMDVDLYPGNIRCVHVCNGGDLVLSDVKNPNINWEALPLELAAQTYPFNRFPFNVAVSIQDNTNHWGVTDLEFLEGLQIELNKMISRQNLATSKAAGVKAINPENSGVANDQFNNAAGILNPRTHMVADSIRYLDPPKVAPEIMGSIQLYMDLFFKVAGTFEFEQARDSKGTLAYQSIATLLEHVATLLRGKIRNYHKLIRERGRMYIGLAQNWYVEERWISYDQGGESITRAIRGGDMIIPAKLNVVSGSTMPVSKIQQREEALRLFEMGAIDNEELLKKLDWSGWKDVLKRMQQGPIGAFIEKLVAMGLPPEAAEILLQLAAMDDKEFAREMEKGVVPPIQALIGEAPEQGPNPLERAELDLKAAQVDKVRTETALVNEKIRTEQVDQDVKRKGIDFDTEKLKIERARTVNDMQRNEKDAELKGMALKTKSDEKKGQGPFRGVKGVKSDNAKV